MLLELADGGVDVALGVVGAAEGDVDDAFVVLFAVPAAVP